MLEKMPLLAIEIAGGIGPLVRGDITSVKRRYHNALARFFAHSINAVEAPHCIQELFRMYKQYYTIGCETGRLDLSNVIEVWLLDSGHTVYSCKGSMLLHRPEGGWRGSQEIELQCAVNAEGKITNRKMFGFAELTDITV